jgi:hypothetical protein
MSPLRLSEKDVRRLGTKLPKAARKPRQAKPKVPVPPERDVQRSILAMIEAEFDAVANHVPTQAMVRGKIKNIHAFMAVRRKDGVVDGWPDLQVRHRPARMCFLEVKRPGEEAEPHQSKVHDELRADGFFVAVVRNDAEARAALLEAGVPVKARRLPGGGFLRVARP